MVGAATAREDNGECPASSGDTNATTRDFGYKEKDLLKPLATHLQNQVCNHALVDTNTDYIQVCSIKAYGQAFESERKEPGGATKRSVIVSVKLEVKWYARSMLGDSTIGTANGVVKVLDICNENMEEEDSWVMETKFDFEYMSNALGNPEASLVDEASPVQKRLKSLLEEVGISPLRAKLKAAIRGFFHSKAEEDGREERTSDPAVNQVEQQVTDLKLRNDLRRQLLGKDFLRVIDGNAAKLKHWKCDFCSVNDTDMDSLVRAMKQNSSLETLSVRYNSFGEEGAAKLAGALEHVPRLTVLDVSNNELGDGGVHALMTALAVGHSPMLKELRLKECKGITEVGRTVIDGLKLLRKDIEIQV